MANIKKNFFYSSILTTANYVFPFVTYPYVSRVLGVTNIGICNFVDSIINYFILFSMMGIGTLGVREIARCSSKAERDRCFCSLFALNTISTTIMLVVLVFCTLFISKLYIYKELMFLGALKLVGNYLLVDWLYRGIEDFRFITIRTIGVKFIYVISVFIFIRDTEDYILYYFLLCLMFCANAAINIIYAKKIITFRFCDLEIKQFVKPFIILGVYMLLTSMYTSFNVMYLGFVSGVTEVGYYTTATKLFSIILALFTAFTTVLQPRGSRLIGENRINEFKSLLSKSIDVLLAFSLPVITFSVLFVSPIIQIISGKGYEGAILPMCIIMPLMFVIGYEQILIVSALMPLKKDNAILVNSLIGAFVGIIMNILLVEKYKSIGSAFVWVTSEIVVLCCAQCFIKKYINMGFPIRNFLKAILHNIPLIVVLCFVLKMNISDVTFQLVLAGLITLLYCFILNYFILGHRDWFYFISKIHKR